MLSAVLLLFYICSSAASLETRCCQFEETGRGSSESSSYINLVAPIGHFVLVPQRNTMCQSFHLFCRPWCLFSRDDLLVVQSVSIGNPPGKFNFDLGCLCVTTARSRQVLLLWGCVCPNALCPFLIVLWISRSTRIFGYSNDPTGCPWVLSNTRLLLGSPNRSCCSFLPTTTGLITRFPVRITTVDSSDRH